jgi:hypothetical protein
MWKLAHLEFCQRSSGERVADNAVERSVSITRYWQKVQKVTKGGRVITIEENVPPNGSMGMKWLASRRPNEWREKKEQDPKQRVGEAFLKALEDMNERAKLRRAERAELIEHEASPLAPEADCPTQANTTAVGNYPVI